MQCFASSRASGFQGEGRLRFQTSTAAFLLEPLGDFRLPRPSVTSKPYYYCCLSKHNTYAHAHVISYCIYS